MKSQGSNVVMETSSNFIFRPRDNPRLLHRPEMDVNGYMRRSYRDLS